jgi:hypothetical protein
LVPGKLVHVILFDLVGQKQKKTSAASGRKKQEAASAGAQLVAM